MRIEFERELPSPWEGAAKWAKCDMIATVGYARLTPIGAGRQADNRRKYIYPDVTQQQLLNIRKGVLCALGLRQLTQHL